MIDVQKTAVFTHISTVFPDMLLAVYKGQIQSTHHSQCHIYDDNTHSNQFYTKNPKKFSTKTQYMYVAPPGNVETLGNFKRYTHR